MLGAKNLNRRSFLRSAGAVAATASLAASERAYSVAPPSALGANERINFALIGGGMRGGNHLPRLKRLEREGKANIRLAAVCEIYDRRKEFMMREAGLPSCYHNYEDVLANPEIHAVVIATPDHWHKKMSIDAMAAGKDVYCEKPMTLHWEEAREVLFAQKLTGRVFTVGAQSASMPVWREAGRFLGDGKTGLLGKLLHFQTSYNRNVPGGDWNYEIFPDCAPKTLDWDRWLGPAPKRGFDVERFFRFRKYWDYSGGLATDLMYHKLAHLSVTLGFPFPTRVASIGGNYIHFDREVPDTMTILAEMENACMGSILATSGNDTDVDELVHGEHGTLGFEGNDAVLVPQAAYMDAVREGARAIEGAQIVEGDEGGRATIREVRLKAPGAPDDTILHLENFIHAIRTGAPPSLGAEEGFRVMATIALGIKAYRESRVCLFDPKSMSLL